MHREQRPTKSRKAGNDDAPRRGARDGFGRRSCYGGQHGHGRDRRSRTLDAVVLTAKQAGPGYTRYTMDGWPAGERAGNARFLRRWLSERSAEATPLSDDLRRPGRRRAALERGRALLTGRCDAGASARSRAGCERARGRRCRAPFPGMAPSGTSRSPLIRDPGLLAGSGSDQDDRRGDRGRPQGTTRHHRHLPAARQLPLRRLRLGRHGEPCETRRARFAPLTQAPTTCCAAIS